MSKFVVGLTGGIGSGKSVVSDCFAELGIAIVDADKAARVVVEPDKQGFAQIVEHFGPRVQSPDGSLNRTALRSIVFAEPDERKWLEGVLHPRITIEIFNGIRNANSPYVILVSPLLFEARQDTLTKRILVVDASEGVQIARTVARDGDTEQQVRAIMDTQLDRNSRLARAHDVIENNGSLAELKQRVRALHEQYLALASAYSGRSSRDPG